MKRQVTLTLFCTLLMALVGCEAETTSLSDGPFHVDGNTGRATGQALGIHFEAAGATGVHAESQLKAGKPEHTSASTEITLADDAIIQLEMLEGGSPISFQLNGTDLGTLDEGRQAVGCGRVGMEVEPRPDAMRPIGLDFQETKSLWIVTSCKS
jgi:hypothetical protein